nr:MAG TPA: hypothetical protein [Caudoviricetes sp.]
MCENKFAYNITYFFTTKPRQIYFLVSLMALSISLLAS